MLNKKGTEMSKFVKDNFHGSEYVNYLNPADGSNKFVARFKYVRGNKGSFITFLVKNFTVEEYFGRLEAGETPCGILQSKGYIQAHIKKMLKQKGYEISQAGFDRLVQDQVAARNRLATA